MYSGSERSCFRALHSRQTMMHRTPVPLAIVRPPEQAFCNGQIRCGWVFRGNTTARQNSGGSGDRYLEHASTTTAIGRPPSSVMRAFVSARRSHGTDAPQGKVTFGHKGMVDRQPANLSLPTWSHRKLRRSRLHPAAEAHSRPHLETAELTDCASEALPGSPQTRVGTINAANARV